MADSRTPEVYWESAFQVWYKAGQPVSWDVIHDMLPEPPGGNKPGIAAIKQAYEVYGWATRADNLNAQAIQIVETDLVAARADMFRRQAQEAYEIAQSAKQHILAEGFDSSASAISAYFKATEQERTAKGAAELIMKINNMSQEELVSRAMKLLKRKNESSVDADVIDTGSIEEDINADSPSPSTHEG